MKRLLAGLILFLAGVAVSFGVILNPLELHWIHLLQSKLGIEYAAPAPAEPGQLWTCGMHPQVIQDEPGTCPICQMELTPLKASASASPPPAERKIKHWEAPMDPTFISDRPGKSPMGMDLVPVYEDESGPVPPGTVEIDPVFVQNMGVQSEPVQRIDIPFTIRTVGSFTYNDQQMSWLTTKYSGWIEKVYVNYVGETVRQGQKLFEIYSPELVTTQKEYLQAMDYSERMSTSGYPDIEKRARSLIASARERLALWDVSTEELRELEKTRQVRRTLAVTAASGGMVVEKMSQAMAGMFVRPGMNLYQLVNLSTIWLEAEIFEDQVSRIKAGQHARVELPYQAGRQMAATVRYIHPSFNQKTRSVKVSMELPNPGMTLRADMYADVVFDIPSARGVLAVPTEAIIHSGTRDIVVLDQGGGKFQVREVELGINGDGVWEVLQGVQEGDLIVVSSQFLIDSESNLREAIRKIVSSR